MTNVDVTLIDKMKVDLDKAGIKVCGSAVQVGLKSIHKNYCRRPSTRHARTVVHGAVAGPVAPDPSSLTTEPMVESICTPGSLKPGP